MSVPCLSSGFLVLTAISEKNIYTGPCRLYYASWIFFPKNNRKLVEDFEQRSVM